jgi:hypothetical protein
MESERLFEEMEGSRDECTDRERMTRVEGREWSEQNLNERKDNEAMGTS